MLGNLAAELTTRLHPDPDDLRRFGLTSRLSDINARICRKRTLRICVVVHLFVCR
jgi:hypothetical protein